MMRRQNGAWAALGTLSLDYAPWSFLVKGWMVRVVIIIDRRVSSPYHLQGEAAGEEQETQSGSVDGEKGGLFSHSLRVG